MIASDLDSNRLTPGLPDSGTPDHALELTIRWGDTVLDSVHVEGKRTITAGNQGDLRVDGFEDERLAINHGRSASIHIPPGTKAGLWRTDGTVVEVAHEHVLQLGERLVYALGALTVVAQFVHGAAALGRAAPVDWHFPKTFAISTLLHSFVVLAALVTPSYGRSRFDELMKSDPRFIQAILKAPEVKAPPKKLELSGTKAGGKHKGVEGKFGEKDKPPRDALASKAGAPRVDPDKRAKDLKIAMSSGLLGILKGPGAESAVSNVLGPGGIGTGINAAMGGLRGATLTDAGGAGGLGSRGNDSGGGGNSLGIGGIGRGPGRGPGGDGNIDLGQRGKGTIQVPRGKTIIVGSLSKEEIGRVIRRDLARFKHCYEKELARSPNLAGKVSLYFTIAPTGSVADASIQETSLEDDNVEACVTKVMRSLKFPAPRGGGIVVVTYPFVFAST